MSYETLLEFAYLKACVNLRGGGGGGNSTCTHVSDSSSVSILVPSMRCAHKILSGRRTSALTLYEKHFYNIRQSQLIEASVDGND